MTQFMMCAVGGRIYLTQTTTHGAQCDVRVVYSCHRETQHRGRTQYVHEKYETYADTSLTNDIAESNLKIVPVADSAFSLCVIFRRPSQKFAPSHGGGSGAPLYTVLMTQESMIQVTKVSICVVTAVSCRKLY